MAKKTVIQRKQDEVMGLVTEALTERGTPKGRAAIKAIKKLTEDPEIAAHLREALSELTDGTARTMGKRRAADSLDKIEQRPQRDLLRSDIARSLHVSITLVNISIVPLSEE